MPPKGKRHDRKYIKNRCKARFAISELGYRKKKAEEGIKNAPNIYSARVKKISNKKRKKALESDLENYAVKSAQKELYN